MGSVDLDQEANQAAEDRNDNGVGGAPGENDDLYMNAKEL